MTIAPDSPYLADASGFSGSAAELFVPADEAAVAQLLKDANTAGMPVTIAGAGSGVTGGRVPQGGWLISLEKLNSISVHSGYAVCGAGASLNDLMNATVASKQFYAPDPTEWSASLGGTIATNASGSRSFLYGDTRRHVRAIHVVLMSGERLVLRRGEPVPFPFDTVSAPGSTKNTAGYYLRPGIDYLDLFIGAEGTLGVITQCELTLLPAPSDLFTGVVFFPGDTVALDAVDTWRPVEGLRMLEYLDAASLDLLRPRDKTIPQAARAAILIEQATTAGGDEEDRWIERLEASGALLEESWFATSARDRERFRAFRHSLPEVVNDLVRSRKLTKMGSDFAVPIEKNREMLAIYRETLEREFPGQYCIFGHIGDAHLHVNILPADEAQWLSAKELMTELARQAVALGGTVSAEHGLGKRKRHLLPLQFTPLEIEAMRTVKRRLDPNWLLGVGTLFDRE